jgi:hypothetical protein
VGYALDPFSNAPLLRLRAPNKNKVWQFGLSGMTAWRRLGQWTRAGVFEQLQRLVLEELGRFETMPSA